MNEIEQALEELAKSSKDRELVKQIYERLEYNKRRLDTFINNRNGYIFHLTGVRNVNCQTDMRDIDLGYFKSHEIAKKWGLKFLETFSVKKVRLLSENDNPKSLCSENYLAWDAGMVLGEICYDIEGNILGFWCNELGETPVEIFTTENRGRFEHAYIDIPYPFRTGDIVRVVDSESSVEFGIVTCERTEVEYQAKREKLNNLNLNGVVDFTDCAVTVNFINKNGNFNHDHINPLRLEYAKVSDDIPHKEALECARDVLIGKGDLEAFLCACEKIMPQTSSGT
ncbi:MAG TPA: hypothetical protein GXZ70_02720 [Clostridiales bacterium]|nr:hypothetical protein [Clostridiales bacterium]